MFWTDCGTRTCGQCCVNSKKCDEKWGKKIRQLLVTNNGRTKLQQQGASIISRNDIRMAYHRCVRANAEKQCEMKGDTLSANHVVTTICSNVQTMRGYMAEAPITGVLPLGVAHRPATKFDDIALEMTSSNWSNSPFWSDTLGIWMSRVRPKCQRTTKILYFLFYPYTNWDNAKRHKMTSFDQVVKTNETAP